MGCESFDVVRFDFGPLLQGQRRIAKLKSAYNSLIIGHRGLQWETNLWEVMGCESSDVVRFDLGWPFPVDTSCIWPQMRPWSSYMHF